jgi:hypothetical protein
MQGGGKKGTAVYQDDYWRAHRSDYQRVFDWVNQEGWKFDPPPRRRPRATIARMLLTVAAWIADATQQPQAAIDQSASIVE